MTAPRPPCMPLTYVRFVRCRFANSPIALSVKPLANTYLNMLKGDPKRCVDHASMAVESLTSIVTELEALHPEWKLGHLVGKLSPIVAMSFREYDKEFREIEETDPVGLERLVALPDDEPWERNAVHYPAGENGERMLAQPQLGYDATWMLEGHEAERDARFSALMAQGYECQLQVKSRLLRLEAPLPRDWMEGRWPKGGYLGGWQMVPWGGGEAFDPGIKSGAGLKDKVELVHKGDWSQIKDVSRIVLYYPDASSLLEGLEKLQKAFRCLRVVNHFRHPTVLGWRDVTVFVEESVEACNRARHICEIRLQLNGYAIVRKHAHYYFELIRKVIVSCAKVSLASNRLKLLATLLDAIESTPSRSSDQLILTNHRKLQDVYSSCFGEMWAAATCVSRQPPASLNQVDEPPSSAASHSTRPPSTPASHATQPPGSAPHTPAPPATPPYGSSWSMLCDVQDQTDPIRDNDAPAADEHERNLALKSEMLRRATFFKEERTYEKVAKLIVKAARANLAIHATVDSCLRKLKIGTFDTLINGGVNVRALTLALLDSDEMKLSRPGRTEAAEEVLLGSSHANLRLGDLLTDSRGGVWCSVLDGVSKRQCSSSPSLHELQITYGSLALSSMLDLLEVWQLSWELADLDFGRSQVDGLTDLIEAPEKLRGHRVRQAFVAAAGLRQYAWAYAGSQARESGGALDLINLQHAGLLASRYVLFGEFVTRSSYSTTWAVLGMLMNFDRASGPSLAKMTPFTPARSDLTRVGRALRETAHEYYESMDARASLQNGQQPGGNGRAPSRIASSTISPRLSPMLGRLRWARKMPTSTLQPSHSRSAACPAHAHWSSERANYGSQTQTAGWIQMSTAA